MVPVMVFNFPPLLGNSLYSMQYLFNSNFIYLISVIFLRDVTIGIRAKVLKIFLK